MKKYLKLANLWLILLLCLTFTSCESDSYDAYCLTGSWQGSFVSNVSCRLRINNQTVTEVLYPTESFVQFIPDHSGATSGIGYQVDFFDSRSPYSWTSNTFEWYVDNGEITIRYSPKSPYQDYVKIRDFHLSTTEFNGVVNNTKLFSMTKIDDGFEWGNYINGPFNYRWN